MIINYTKYYNEENFCARVHFYLDELGEIGASIYFGKKWHPAPYENDIQNYMSVVLFDIYSIGHFKKWVSKIKNKNNWSEEFEKFLIKNCKSLFARRNFI